MTNAMELDVFNSKDKNLRTLTNNIFEEIEETLVKKFKSPDRAKQSLKMVLINLWIANLMGMPVRYSRSRSDYVHDARYGQLFFRFDTLIPVIDSIEFLEYIEQKIGRSRYEDKSSGFQTRMWATHKLIKLFIEYQMIAPSFFNKPEPEELIILNKEVKVNTKNKSKKIKTKKVEVKYLDSKHTKQMREDLEKYRAFVKKHHINVSITEEQVITYGFLFDLYKRILKKRNTVEFVEYNQKGIRNSLSEIFRNRNIKELYTDNYISKPITILNTINKTLPITCMFPCNDTTDKDLHRLKSFHWIWDFVWFLSQKYREMTMARSNNDDILNEEFQLNDIGIKRLQFSLNQEILYRVFNRKSFEKGGRAFGATYQRLPKHMRKGIFINNEPTVEIDYSAYHIRMLYHLNGIDYTEDPYIVCGGEKYRKAFKCASLVIINAKNEAEAKSAIRDELIDSRIPFPDLEHPLNWMVDRFKEAHQPIAEFICSDYGVKLQNIDSHIMNAILMGLMERGILGLSLYDSVIVAEQYEEVLQEMMVSEYKKVMGFEPMLKRED
uniref:Uncharacterized protein n=1 Tax=uncultured Desulfobacterium sp. TaxID=201089 RepID=E1YCX9_9BACT|nr:hypothetical protein N47_G37470 [uncultured Desulfobacterium sp.]